MKNKKIKDTSILSRSSRSDVAGVKQTRTRVTISRSEVVRWASLGPGGGGGGVTWPQQSLTGSRDLA